MKHDISKIKQGNRVDSESILFLLLQVRKVKDHCNKNLQKLMEELQYMEMVGILFRVNSCTSMHDMGRTIATL